MFDLPFGIFSISGGVVNGKVVLFALGTSHDITLSNASLPSLLILFLAPFLLFKNVSLYLITFNGESFNVSTIASNVSYWQVISNGVYTYAIKNSTIVSIYNGKIGSGINLKIKNFLPLMPLALGKNAVSLEGLMNGSLESEILVINTTNGEIMKNITDFSIATPVMNSSNSEFIVLFSNDSIVVYNYLGEQIENINIGITPNTNHVELFGNSTLLHINTVELFGNSTLLFLSASIVNGTILPNVTAITYVNIQGKWMKYTTYLTLTSSTNQII
jgi:hypothetical protein